MLASLSRDSIKKGVGVAHQSINKRAPVNKNVNPNGGNKDVYKAGLKLDEIIES